MKLCLLALLACLGFGGVAQAADLEGLFSKVATCHFDKFYYDEPARNKPHPYFTERSLKPYKEVDGLYYFHVKEQVFGLPVVELIVPGTQDLHALIFDVPLARARKAISAKFGNAFKGSQNSREGKAPELATDPKNINRSVFYCVEGEGG